MSHLVRHKMCKAVAPPAAGHLVPAKTGRTLSAHPLTERLRLRGTGGSFLLLSPGFGGLGLQRPLLLLVLSVDDHSQKAAQLGVNLRLALLPAPILALALVCRDRLAVHPELLQSRSARPRLRESLF